MSSIRLSGHHVFNVQFSPLLPNVLASPTSQCYGFKGQGSLFIFQTDDTNNLQTLACLTWPEGLVDVSWSQASPDLLVTCSVDGSVHLWSLTGTELGTRPMCVWQEHSADVSALDWVQEFIASCSWDSTIKLWDVHNKNSISTWHAHDDVINAVKWSPFHSNLLCSVASDTKLKLWDSLANCCTLVAEVQNSQILDCDWSKLDQNLLATCASNAQIQVWDVRKLRRPLCELCGHDKAVRRVKWSPHHSNVLASVSFDLKTIIWDRTNASLLETISHHSSFVFGIDFHPSLHFRICDGGWDSIIHVFEPVSIKEFGAFSVLKTIPNKL